MGTLIDVLVGVAAILAALVPAASHWFGRPYARLNRALTVYRDMPTGRERDSWGDIVNAESQALRRRLEVRGKSDEIAGYCTAGVAAAGLVLQSFAMNWSDASAIGLLVWFAFGLVLGVVMIVTGRRQYAADTQRFAESERQLQLM